MDASGSNVAPSSLLNQTPHLEISLGNLPLLAQQMTPQSTVPPSLSQPPQTNETSCILHEERREPNQLGTEGNSNHCTQLSPIPASLVHPPHHQTQSMSWSMSCSASHSSAVQSTSLEHVKFLEGQLTNAQKDIEELEDKCKELENTSREWKTHCYFLCDMVTQLQGQLQAKDK